MLPTIEFKSDQIGYIDVPEIKVNENEKWIKHVHCKGARFHVLRYVQTSCIGIFGETKSVIRCSEPDCIYNKE